MLRSLICRLLHKIAFVAPGGASLRPWLHRVRGAKIGKNVWIAQLVYLDELHPADITMGDNCTIGLRTSIFTHFYWGPKRSQSNGKVMIGNDVFIGDGAVIRAGTVVSRNVPPHTFLGSPPAQALGTATVALTASHSYEEFARGLRPRPRTRSTTDDPASLTVA